MKRYSILSLLAFITITFSSCEVIGGIFKAGVWTGIIAVVAIIVIIGWLVSRAGKK